MKRLQRETFPDVMRLMDKHEQIDRILSMYRAGMGFHFPELPVRAKVALDAVGALLLVDDEELDHAREILGEAGNRTGLNSRSSSPRPGAMTPLQQSFPLGSG